MKEEKKQSGNSSKKIILCIKSDCFQIKHIKLLKQLSVGLVLFYCTMEQEANLFTAAVKSRGRLGASGWEHLSGLHFVIIQLRPQII